MKKYNLVITFAAYLILICPQIEAKNSFVIDCSQPTGKILNVHFDKNNINTSIAIDDAMFFDCVPEGYCVYRNKAGDWLAGNIQVPSKIQKIEPSMIPKDIIYATISHDGRKIAWVTHKENQSSLIVTEIVNGKSNILVSKQGYIDVPSWSPDNTHIAYYYGPPDAIIKDGYSLMLIEDAAIGQKEIQIAPPSLWTKLSPSRTIPPQWSPDGTTILFEGRYDEEIPFAIRYLVGEKGENLRKSVAGFWGKDSKSLFTIKDVNDTILGHQFKLGMIDPSSGEMNLDVFKTSLPKDCFNLIWSDDGEHIVFSTFSNNCYLMETKTGKQRQFYKCDGPCKFYWLSQTSISSNNLRRWVLFFGIFVLSIVLFIIIRFRKWSNILPLKK